MKWIILFTISFSFLFHSFINFILSQISFFHSKRNVIYIGHMYIFHNVIQVASSSRGPLPIFISTHTLNLIYYSMSYQLLYSSGIIISSFISVTFVDEDNLFWLLIKKNKITFFCQTLIRTKKILLYSEMKRTW